MNKALLNQVFRDSSLQKKFATYGYVIVPDLLNKEEIQRLTDLFSASAKQFTESFHTTHFSNNVNYKQQVHDSICSVAFPKAAPYLNNFIPLFGNFMIKNPDPNVAMDLHADWAYVDEREYTSAAIWIPLVDTNVENGCFGLIEGSHKITNDIRGPLIQQSSRNRDLVWEKKHGKHIPLKAGDAIIYNHRLLHFSPPNKSKLPRPAFNLTVVPKDVPLVHYCMPEGTDEILVYEVRDSEFYIRYNHFQKPETGILATTLPKSTIKFIDPLMENFRALQFKNRIKNWLGWKK